MSKPDPIADHFNELLDEPPEQATLRGAPAAAQLHLAWQLRGVCQAIQPDAQFVAQLEARLVLPERPQPVRGARAGQDWFDRLRRAISAQKPMGRAMLTVTSLLVLMGLAFLAVVLLMQPGRDRHGEAVPGQMNGYLLSATLPSAPAQVPLFRQSATLTEWHASEARQVAAQLGLPEPLSLTITGPGAYNVSDGMRLIDLQGDLIVYQDTSVPAHSQDSPSYEQAIAPATAFLTAHGLLNFPYRTEPGDAGQVRFVRLADGRPVQSADMPYEAQLNVAADGRIAEMRYISRTLSAAGQVGIISAADAWQTLLRSHPLAEYRSAPVTQSVPSSPAPPTDAAGNVNGLEGRLTVFVYEYSGAISPTQRIKASLAEWHSGVWTPGGWHVDLDGQNLAALAQYEGLRLKVWGHYDAAAKTITLERYEQADPSERYQALLGVVSGTVMGDGVLRSVFTTQDGQRFLLADSLRCLPQATICPANVPTDRAVLIEGVYGQESFNGTPVLHTYSVQSGTVDMTERELAERKAHPFYVIPVATALPQPTALVPNIPPYLEGQRVEGLEGYVNAVIYQDQSGQTTRIQASLAVLPLEGSRWGGALDGALLQGLAQCDGLRVRVWGFYAHDQNGQPMIRVVNYEKADPAEEVQAWLGTLLTATVTNRSVTLLQTREGESFVLASSLFAPEGAYAGMHAPPWGRQVVQEGVLRPETLGGYRVIQDGVQRAGIDVDQMTDLRGYVLQQHPLVSITAEPALSKTVEQVALIYYTDVTPKAVPASVAVRPVWRFSGHTSGGVSFQTLVDATNAGSARVTLDAFSGRPNPTWQLAGAEVADLLASLKTLPSSTASPATEGVLGYRGMLIGLTDASTGATQQWRVFDGVVMGQGVTLDDPQRRFERWLLHSGVAQVDAALYAQLAQQIDAALPQVWTPTLELPDGLDEEPASSWNDSTLFFLVLIDGQPVALNRKDPSPLGCLIKWDAQRQRLVDSCLGSEYDRHGTWLSGPALQDMNRFPARFNGTRVEVDFTRTIEGTFRGLHSTDANDASTPTSESGSPAVVTREVTIPTSTH
jgi:hypothetical protein